MRRLSDESRQVVNTDEFYRRCCVCQAQNPQIHHNLIHGRRQVDDWWALLPLCVTHHSRANEVTVRKVLNHIMLQRAPSDELKKYSKVRNLVQEKESLRIYFKRNPWQPNEL